MFEIVVSLAPWDKRAHSLLRPSIPLALSMLLILLRLTSLPSNLPVVSFLSTSIHRQLQSLARTCLSLQQGISQATIIRAPPFLRCPACRTPPASPATWPLAATASVSSPQISQSVPVHWKLFMMLTPSP